MKSSRCLPLGLLCVMAFSSSLAAQTEAAPPLAAGGETIDVEIKVVPFYAVDREGQPVFDLKQDEVELRIDGQAVPIDVFDAFANPGALEPASETAAKAARKASGLKQPRRHVVLFFDVSFSNVHGFNNGKKFAEQILGELPETDLLYLVTHDFVSGLKQRLGPIAATPSGRSRLLADLKKLKPEAGHLDSHATYGSFALVDRGMRKNGVPSNQNSALDYGVRANSQAQLEGTARSLAESMQALADQFQRINEPKLLVFLSQGISPTLYWEGSEIALQFSTFMTSYQYRGLHTLYQKPLEQLADTGTMSLFVNLDDKGIRASQNDSSMQHMATASGGLYLGGTDPALVSDRFARSTAAYYEAGFYLGDAAQKPSRAKMEIVVKRPGVRTWSAGSIKTRETWRGLTDEARRLFIVDLIEGDAALQKARSRVRLDLQNLPGTVLGRSQSGKTLLRYEAGWPQELKGRKIDLYNVMLEPTRQPGSPQVLQFDRAESTHLDAAGRIAARDLEVEVPKKATFVWGIVAVEPTTGRAWYRRFQLQGKP